MVQPDTGRLIEVTRPGPIGPVTTHFDYDSYGRLITQIEDQDGFCFAQDIYEIVLEHLSYQGVSGRIFIANASSESDQPTDPANVSRALMRFFPNGLQSFNIQQYIVTQRTDGAAIIFEVPLAAFGFPSSNDDDAIFNVSARIVRFTAPNQFVNISFTAIVTVDFVDPPPP